MENRLIILNGPSSSGKSTLARILRDLILKKNPRLRIRIDHVGPVIGAHCGPGTLAICFLGHERTI